MKARVLAILSVVVLGVFSSAAALAQDHSRNWESGNVIQVTHVHIKDGMFNAYINDLNNVWRKFLEAQKADGLVLDYAMYSNPNSREGEPDLILTVSYANWAAFDTGAEYFEELSTRLMGSSEKMREANIDRGELRSIGNTFVLREIKFKD